MSCKSSLFPILEEEVGPLGERAKQLVATGNDSPGALRPQFQRVDRPSEQDRYAVPCAFGGPKPWVYDPIAALHCFLAG